jgi:benzoyl-CoA reductase subunit C
MTERRDKVNPGEKFREIVHNRHEYARQWKKKTGKKVIGYFCTYVPEEILYAADILPVRIIGSHEPQDVTEPYIFNMFCPFSRDCLAQGLKGEYDYLDGIMTAHSCLHIRQTFSSWVRHVPVSYNHYLFMPAHIYSPSAHRCVVGELDRLKSSLEHWTGKAISESALDHGIEVYNTNRRLLKKVYELRKNINPSISGTEAMEMVLASMFMDKQDHNQLLEKLLAEQPQSPRIEGPTTRLMLIGSESDDIELLRLIESLGANVVIDDHCTGTRYFWNEVIVEEDRLSAIADRYISKPPCPLKDLVERHRFPHILKLAEDYNVQGVFLVQQKFCDPHEFDMAPIESLFKAQHIPTLFLELDTTIPAGQFRTRIEAFLELLELELA